MIAAVRASSPRRRYFHSSDFFSQAGDGFHMSQLVAPLAMPPDTVKTEPTSPEKVRYELVIKIEIRRSRSVIFPRTY